ncbi:hypothetical protein FACS1894201_01850 [Bacteroidia bacterium]|nr:hypothetical protein FACS1894201_01850 [Bacteroidia bacterium]
MKHSLLLICSILITVWAAIGARAQTVTPTGGIVYVTVTGDGIGDGSSWSNAYAGLADPLLAAMTNPAITQIWVAKGTYYPQHNAADVPTADPRDKAFVLVNNVKIYGGFEGIMAEMSIDDRDLTPPAYYLIPPAYKTILSGDIGIIGNNTDNAYHVVISAGAVNATLLDGFTITGGNADGSGAITVNSQLISQNAGGGMYNDNSSPTLTNVTISWNSADEGGGMCNSGSSLPTLTNVTIIENSADEGGGMYNDNSSPTLTNVIISGNSADEGGGMCNSGSSLPTLTNVTISGNSASASGGGMCNSGSSSPTLTNVTISGNSASASGGGMCNSGSSSPTLTNVTISGNSASASGGGMCNSGSSSPTLTNCIVWGNTASSGDNVDNDGSSAPTYAYSVVEGQTLAGTGNLDGTLSINDPLFVTWIDPTQLGWMATPDGDYRLLFNSPCIDAGDNTANTTLTDLAGFLRIVGIDIDMGAYETILPTPDGSGIVYVTETGAGIGDGSSWTDAYAGLANPLFAAKTNTAIQQIWVAKGSYNPQYKAAAIDNFSTPTTYSDKAFVLVNNVKIYGGFEGNEALITDRDLTNPAYVTSLGSNITNYNIYHIVISAGDVGSALLDGFTIAGGYADGSGNITVNSQHIYQNVGSGMYNANSSPTLTNVTISGNSADEGGGMYNNYLSSPTLTNVTISGNYAYQNGGGMYNANSSPTLTNVTISGNYAYYGGGGMYNAYSSPTLTNVTISGNYAYYGGGGMYNAYSSPALTNSILWGNIASSGNNVYDVSSAPTYAYSVVEGQTLAGTGNLDGTLPANDPLFVTWIYPGWMATPDGDYSLQLNSPAIGAGDTVAYKTIRSIANFTGEKDVAGDDRLQLYLIDMGAYESPYKARVRRATAVLPNTVYGTALAPSLIGGTNPAGADTVYLYAASQYGLYAETPVPVDTGTYWLKGVIAETPASYADTTAAVSFRITPATLTVTAEDTTRLYGNTNPAFRITYAGWKYSDGVGALTTAPTATTTITATKPVGAYTDSIEVSGGEAKNYVFSYVAGALTIDPDTLTVTAVDTSRLYGNINPTFRITYAGWKNSDGVSDLNTPPTATTTITATKPVGAYTDSIEVSGGLATNYAFKYVAGDLTINKDTLTVTAVDTIRLYGDTNPAFRITYTGWKNSDGISDLTPAPTASTTATTGSAIGAYPITTASGASNNYAFKYVAGDLTINKNTLTVTAVDTSRLYGDANPTFRITYTGWKNGESESDLTPAPTASTTATIGSAVGTYTITAASGASGNYAFKYVARDLTINKDTLTVTAVDTIRLYGDTNPTFRITYSGWKNGEGESDLTTPPTASSTITATKPVGAYTDSIEVSGGAATNYAFKYVAGNLTIDKDTLTVTAVDTTRLYGNLNPTFRIAYTGWKNGESESDLTPAPTVSTTATIGSAVGTYSITAASGASNNYAFKYVAGDLTIGQDTLTVKAVDTTRLYGNPDPAFRITYTGWKNIDGVGHLTTVPTASSTTIATTSIGVYANSITAAGGLATNYAFKYVAGKLTIDPDTLTVTAVDTSRLYGNLNPTFRIAYTGWKNGESESDLTPAPTASTTATTGSAVGTYPITAASGASNNYAFKYVAGDLTIDPDTLTVTAVDTTRLYGNLNPTFRIAYTGWKNGESESDLTPAPTASTTATTGSAVGAYPITTASGASNNYAFKYVAGTLTIGKDTLTVTAVDTSRLYGNVNPAFRITYSGWKNSDGVGHLSIVPTANTTITAAKPVGAYTDSIEVSGGLATNYAFKYVAGDLTIGQDTLTVTAEDTTRLYGDANPAFRITYSGWKNSDGVGHLTTVPTASTTATAATPAGAYPITVAGGASGNYAFKYVDGKLTIGNNIPIVITFAPADTLQLESGNYTLAATTTNGVVVKFRISGSTTAANIDASTNTLLHLYQSGSVTVTAYIDDTNYSAADVSRTIAIVSNNTNVTSVTVSNTTPVSGIANFYLADCEVILAQVTVTLAENGSQVVYDGVPSGGSFDVDISRADIHDVAYTVLSTDGNTQDYSLRIERRFVFDEIVGMKFNNVLYVDNNEDNNGGYEFTSYEWFRDGRSIGIGQYYSAGPSRTDLLDPTADYSAAMTTINGKQLHTCTGRVTLTPTASLQAYPSPVQNGAEVTIESGAADGSLIRIYNVLGVLVGTQPIFGNKVQLSLPLVTGVYLITLDGESIKISVE